MTDLKGIIVPLLTPFTDDDRVDVEALTVHVDVLIRAGVHGVLPTASTGEALSLSPDEYQLVIETTVAAAGGRVPVVAGCSAYSTKQVLHNVSVAVAAGADSVMITHPYYALPDERELRAHYRRVSEGVATSVIIYNNPATTGIDASPELLAELTELPHLDAVKESSGDCSRVMRINHLTGGRVPVYCGTDNQALEQFVGGAAGWIAGVANAIPEQCVDLYNLITDGRLDDARRLYSLIYPYLLEAELSGKYVQINKAAVGLLGRSLGNPRSPLLPVDDDAMDRVRAALKRAERVPTP